MSEGRQSGINRAFSWLKKTLEITEKTVSPDALSPIVVPSMDVFGWERYFECRARNVNGVAAADNVFDSSVPVDTMRLIISASVQTSDNANALHLWFEHRVTNGGIDLAVSVPFLAPAGTAGMRVGGSDWPILLCPGDRLAGRSSPAPAAGQNISMRIRSVDLRVGEYMPKL